MRSIHNINRKNIFTIIFFLLSYGLFFKFVLVATAVAADTKGDLIDLSNPKNEIVGKWEVAEPGISIIQIYSSNGDFLLINNYKEIAVKGSWSIKDGILTIIPNSFPENKLNVRILHMDDTVLVYQASDGAVSTWKRIKAR